MSRGLRGFFSLFLAGVCGVFFVSGCAPGEQAFPRLATPSSTMASYLTDSPKLLGMTDLKSYMLCIGCFSKADRDWFDNNFATLPFSKSEDDYKMLSLAQKKAYAFGEIVVKAGPKADNPTIFVRELTADTAVVQIQDVPGEYHLVKEGPNWRIKGLFGVDERG